MEEYAPPTLSSTDLNTVELLKTAKFYQKTFTLTGNSDSKLAAQNLKVTLKKILTTAKYT